MYSWANKEKATTATNEKQRKVTPQRNSSNKREEANEGTTATQKATKEHRMGSNRKATNVNQKDSMKRRSNEGTTANEKATKEQRRTNEGTKGTKEARQQRRSNCGNEGNVTRAGVGGSRGGGGRCRERSRGREVERSRGREIATEKATEVKGSHERKRKREDKRNGSV